MQTSQLIKAMADEGRLRVLAALSTGELCVCQITELLGLATPTVSRHMSILQQAGLVTSRKAGRWVFYRLIDSAACPPAVQGLIDSALASLQNETTIQHDQQKLREILSCDPEDLCRKQGK